MVVGLDISLLLYTNSSERALHRYTQEKTLVRDGFCCNSAVTPGGPALQNRLPRPGEQTPCTKKPLVNEEKRTPHEPRGQRYTAGSSVTQPPGSTPNAARLPEQPHARGALPPQPGRGAAGAQPRATRRCRPPRRPLRGAAGAEPRPPETQRPRSGSGVAATRGPSGRSARCATRRAGRRFAM